MLDGMTAKQIVIIGGGQSGLAAARVARDTGHEPLVLEAGTQPAGSWPRYYDSLRLFSPAAFSGFPGVPFPGHKDHYPSRDEVVEFLTRYAAWLAVDIRTQTKVSHVTTTPDGFEVTTGDETLTADAVIAATGAFGNPYLPAIPGRDSFEGEIVHVADYRGPERFAGQRVVVVGAGNSAVQVAHELSEVSRVSLAVRRPVQFVPQVRGGHDMHYWLKKLGLDLLPPAVLARLFHGTLVFDTGLYQGALDAARYDQKPMFTAFGRDGVIWSNDEREPVDVVLFATGYRPNLPYLGDIEDFSPAGTPGHRRGISARHPALGYLGLEYQRSFSSNTLRGVHRDAGFVVNKVLQPSQRGMPTRRAL